MDIYWLLRLMDDRRVYGVRFWRGDNHKRVAPVLYRFWVSKILGKQEE